VAAYERALAGRREDPLLLVELDQAGEAAGHSPARRLKPFEENRATALRKDRAVGRMARLCVLLGRYDEALDLLTKHHFHLWEGEAGMYGLYVEARARRGEKLLAAGRPDEALLDFEEALRVPPNIEVWAEFGEGRPRMAYLMGLARKARGRAAEAKACFEEAASARGGGAMSYYAGRALLELGRGPEAERVFGALVESSRRRAATGPEAKNFHEREEGRRRRAEAHYAAGLGLLGLGREAEARAEFEKAVRFDASHAGAWRALARD
jgi:tetratricopeptide (TPR) repeat protein